jgi:small subunit ribosomal protein S20
MANTKSAAKRARQTTARTVANRRSLSIVKTQLRTVREVMKSGKKDEATTAARAFFSSLDKAAKAGRVHRNTANRHKARINKTLAGLS